MEHPKDNLNNMIGLDLFVHSMGSAAAETNFHLKAISVLPLTNWEFSGTHFTETLITGLSVSDKQQLRQFAKKHDWQPDFYEAFSQPYEALIVTDSSQKIIWTNKGFTEMTGYTAKHALGKTPQFLQGQNTSEESVNFIRHELLLNKPFTAIITNYKKNSDEYLCEVRVFPIYNQQNETTHFIAVEKQIAV